MYKYMTDWRATSTQTHNRAINSEAECRPGPSSSSSHRSGTQYRRSPPVGGALPLLPRKGTRQGHRDSRPNTACAANEVRGYSVIVRPWTLTLDFVAPGMGMMSSPCARSQAKAICPEVAPCTFPIAATASAAARIFGKFSFENLEGVFTLSVPETAHAGLPRLALPEVPVIKIVGGFLLESSSSASAPLEQDRHIRIAPSAAHAPEASTPRWRCPAPAPCAGCPFPGSRCPG